MNLDHYIYKSFSPEKAVNRFLKTVLKQSFADDIVVHAITRYVIKALRTIVRVILVIAYEGTQSDLSGKRELENSC